MQIKHEEICSVVKALKDDKEVLTQETNSHSVDLKAAKKDLKDNSANLNMTLMEYKAAIEKL